MNYHKFDTRFQNSMQYVINMSFFGTKMFGEYFSCSCRRVTLSDKFSNDKYIFYDFRTYTYCRIIFKKKIRLLYPNFTFWNQSAWMQKKKCVSWMPSNIHYNRKYSALDRLQITPDSIPHFQSNSALISTFPLWNYPFIWCK